MVSHWTRQNVASTTPNVQVRFTFVHSSLDECYDKILAVENVNILLITLICVVSVASLIMVGFLYR